MEFLLKEDGDKLLLESGYKIVLRRTIVLPTVGVRGANPLTVFIEAEDGAFTGASVVTFSGTGITVNSTTYIDGTHVNASIAIAAGATLSTRDVTITTGVVVVTFPASFRVAEQGATATLKNAFQYTLLNRSNDIRRTPGVTIQDTLNISPNTCSFVIDGASNAPKLGQKVEIRDEQDNNRLLFAGTMQSIEQRYEGQIAQLSWAVSCIDFTWLLNRRRPMISFVDTSASVIVKQLVANYAPGFTTNHVQTNLAKITVIFNGTDDLTTCLTKIASAIGSGHWYVDYEMDVHFFHTIAPTISLPPTELVAPAKYLTIAQGGASSIPFAAGYYYFRYTYLYSDGSESKFGPISNVVRFDGRSRMVFTDIPIGATRGPITCVGRRLYYNALLIGLAGQYRHEEILTFCQINDNVTTGFSTGWRYEGADNAAVGVAAPVKTYSTSLVPTPTGMVLLTDQAASWNLTGAVPNGSYGLPPAATQVVAPDAGTLVGPGVACLGFNPAQSLIFRWTASNVNGETTPSIAGLTYVMTGTAGYATGPQLKNPAMPYGALTLQVYVSTDGGANFHAVTAPTGGLSTWSLNMSSTEVAAGVAPPVVNTADIDAVNRGWVGYNGVLLIPSGAWPQPTPGGNIVYFATIDVAATLEAVINARQLVPPTMPTLGHPAGPSHAMTAGQVNFLYGEGYWNSSWATFKVAYLYRDGSVSAPSAESNGRGSQYMMQGLGIGSGSSSPHSNIPIGPTIGNLDVVARLFYACNAVLAGNANGEGPFIFGNPSWRDEDIVSIGVLPNNTDTEAWYEDLPFCAPTINKPYGRSQTITPTTQSVPVWPNPDGPSLEDTDPPLDIDASNDLLLHEDSGSVPFTVSSDLSQVRNRIFVEGAGSTCVVTASLGALEIAVNDLACFSPAGGQIRIKHPSTGALDTIRYSGTAGTPGSTVLQLPIALTREVAQGALINNFVQMDDFESQRLLSKVELYANGLPTDGVHEYTVVDASLKFAAQLYMRGFAELELFSRPIVTIRYATRDPKSRSGRMVHVDMTEPPCQGDFLIQSVTIDQIHDESDDLLPRYTVTASSSRFELNDLLLLIIGNEPMQEVSSAGFVSTSISYGTAAATLAPLWRKGFAQCFLQATNAVAFSVVGGSTASISGAVSNVNDARGMWQRETTAVGVGQNAGFSFNNCFVRPEYNPLLTIYMRSGPSIAKVRIFGGFLATNNNVDDNGNKAIGVRLLRSGVAGQIVDSGLTMFVDDGVSRIVGPVFQWLPNTEYDIAIAVQGDTFIVSLNGVQQSMSIGSNAGRLGWNSSPSWLLWQNDPAGTKYHDIMRMGWEQGLGL